MKITNRKSRRSLFFSPKSKSLAKKISISSPTAFRQSISKLNRNGLTTKNKRALVLAQNRAKSMLNRKNLSPKERKQMRTISKIKLPKCKCKRRY